MEKLGGSIRKSLQARLTQKYLLTWTSGMILKTVQGNDQRSEYMVKKINSEETITSSIQNS